MAKGFSPLDEELKLLPGNLTPTLAEGCLRLGTWLPFQFAATTIEHFTRTNVSEATVRRLTERGGDAYVEVQAEQLVVLAKELPASPPGPALQLMSVDGAFVPLVHKDWAEVKTLALGTVGEPVLEDGQWQVHAKDLSYFSRAADHEDFARAATVEVHRRGTETAGKVVAVNDGAVWEQGFVDYHRPDAVRILDWGHAAEHLVKAGHVLFGKGTADCSEWLGVELQELRHKDPEKVLTELRQQQERLAALGEGEEPSGVFKEVKGCLEYLENRREQIRYAEFAAQGYPIGSGAVESANKLLVEARLKGAGMHWAPEHVNPMVAMRTVACCDRWEEAWPQITARLRQKAPQRSAADGRKESVVSPPQAGIRQGIAKVLVAPVELAAAAVSLKAPAALQTETKPRKPAPDHPWRHMAIGKARFSHTNQVAGNGM